jgi:hypothetical protein
VFLPTHRAGREVEQAPIRLKNLLRQATDALTFDGVRARESDRLLAPLRRLLDDRLFWQYQSDGLALFSRPGWLTLRFAGWSGGCSSSPASSW